MEANNINNNNNDDNNNNNVRRGNRGRQKVEMVKMTNESNLQVTFSKRRAGLFKKASELCTLCNAEIALVVFSPGRKVFSFGHPSVDEIVERYVNSLLLEPDQLTAAGARGDVVGSGSGAGNGNGAIQLIEAHRNANLRELNAQLAQVMGQLDAERKRSEEMNKLRKASQAQCWWENPVDKLDVEQLWQLKKSMEELRKVVNQQADQIMMQASATVNAGGPSAYALAPLPPLPQFYPTAGASGSGQQGGGNMMMVPYNNNQMNTNLFNMNTAGFTTNTGIIPSDPLNNNNNNNHNLGSIVKGTNGMMNMAPPFPLPLPLPPPPPPPPQQQQQQNPQYPHHGYNNNNIGYGRGFY